MPAVLRRRGGGSSFAVDDIENSGKGPKSQRLSIQKNYAVCMKFNFCDLGNIVDFCTFPNSLFYRLRSSMLLRSATEPLYKTNNKEVIRRAKGS